MSKVIINIIRFIVLVFIQVFLLCKKNALTPSPNLHGVAWASGGFLLMLLFLPYFTTFFCSTWKFFIYLKYNTH